MRADIEHQFRSFLSTLPEAGVIAVVCHSDVDGLAAGVIACRAFERLGFDVRPRVTRKGENAWSESVLADVSAQRPDALAVVDLGSRSDAPVAGLPTILIDHHKPTGIPENATLITGYGAEPTPSSGLLAYWCAKSVGMQHGLEWLAAASVLADYGNTALFAETKAAARAAGVSTLRRLTTLLNAPRRTATGDATDAFRILRTAESAADILQPENEAVLLEAKAEVDAALARARKVAPRFSGPVALITIEEGCQVHPMVAQAWRNRLPKNLVMCANIGYLPNRVNFAMRTATSENLLDFLAAYKPAGAGEDYGRGHDKATGGSLTVQQWSELLHSLGFPSPSGITK